MDILKGTSVGHWQLALTFGFKMDVYRISVVRAGMGLLMSVCGCANVINSPTQIACVSAILIDHFITNPPLETLMSGTIACDISDHLAIFMCARKCRDKRSNTKVRLSFQNVNMHTLENVRCKMLNVDLSDMYKETDANKAYNWFLNIFKSIYWKHFPYMHLKTMRGSRKPWVTQEYLGKIQNKSRLYKELIKTKDLRKLIIFKTYRNQVNKKLKVARACYYHNIFCTTIGQTGIMWKRLNLV